MTQEIYLVRHGDAEKLDASGSPIPDISRPLSSKGITDIHVLAAHLANQEVHPTIIISSFLTRAIQTAEIIAEYLDDPPLIRNELIGEANLGNLPNTKQALRDADYGFNTEVMIHTGGETIGAIEKRVLQFLQLLQGKAYDCVIIASHGLTLSVMSQLIQGLDLTFENIQALDTADYSYFAISNIGDKTVVLKQEKNVLKGKLF